MRLWSLNPKYLDAKGLVALWREGLLAKKALEGKTVGYRNHPQLIRFKKSIDPLRAINSFLSYVYLEAVSRGYSFDEKKIVMLKDVGLITVTGGQIRYEFEHLKRKLKIRDINKFREISNCPSSTIEPNPIFKLVKGGIEEWEKAK
ncbi:MAG: pyrimidine dimer DNA glycosylase/endonuclease V [Verrucomicrobiia bacterium]